MLYTIALETVFADMGAVDFGKTEAAAYHSYADNPLPVRGTSTKAA